jgi:hypothetical protein
MGSSKSDSELLDETFRYLDFLLLDAFIATIFFIDFDFC